jgi:hypothetical protein
MYFNLKIGITMKYVSNTRNNRGEVFLKQE